MKRKIEKKLDKLHKKIPAIYKFLVDKGVSYDVAEDAQEMADKYFFDLTEKLESAAEELDEVKSQVLFELGHAMDKIDLLDGRAK